ncbi:hypothetical protein [Micromonospora craniellae]|uniref:Uncharacterized protein n=1 Tax=Micromonospora craniellae TaxID=2294034 RepID=A0A372G3U8_9ACTN|nr:hypothetical protein [Micromonospora craniellae]QOC92108.1 hypothetical protein ID554_30380 [Micromonospora craniellae]RFS47436.1 hypothetical protein D0Q02_05395 [Micromonospora craniellae]
MIPQLVTIRHRRPDGRWRRRYVPVLPVLLLLAPLLLLAVPVALVACLVARVNPAAALRGVGQVLCSLPGTRIEIAQGRKALLVSVR